MSPTIHGKEMILASVTEKDVMGEYFYLAIDTPNDDLKDDAGRMMGYITATTKGEIMQVENIYMSKL